MRVSVICNQGWITRKYKTYAINKGGLNQVDIVRSYREVNRPGTHITNESRPAIGNFMLDIQVPVSARPRDADSINHAITNTRRLKFRLVSGVPVPSVAFLSEPMI